MQRHINKILLLQRNGCFRCSKRIITKTGIQNKKKNRNRKANIETKIFICIYCLYQHLKRKHYFRSARSRILDSYGCLWARFCYEKHSHIWPIPLLHFIVRILCIVLLKSTENVMNKQISFVDATTNIHFQYGFGWIIEYSGLYPTCYEFRRLFISNLLYIFSLID